MAELGYSMTASSISQIENGASTSGPTLAAIAEATGYPVDYFIRRRGDADVPGFFRSLRSTPARERARALARAHLVHELVDALEHYVELPDLDLPDLDVRLAGVDEDEDLQQIENAAEAVRRYWDMGAGPIDHVVRHLERNGVVTCRLPLDRHDVDAFSVNYPLHPVVVLRTDKGATSRSRFAAAHELGHLLLHTPADAGRREAEKQAHRFAAAFLMPAKGIADDLPGDSDWQRLFELKATWRVSVAALLQRAKDLGVMTPARHLNAIKYMSARGWRKQEPAEASLGPPEQPRMIAAALDVLRDDGISLEDIASDEGLPLPRLEEMVGAWQSPRRVRL